MRSLLLSIICIGGASVAWAQDGDALDGPLIPIPAEFAKPVEAPAESIEPEAPSIEPDISTLEPETPTPEPKAVAPEPEAPVLEPETTAPEPKAPMLEPEAPEVVVEPAPNVEPVEETIEPPVTEDTETEIVPPAEAETANDYSTLILPKALPLFLNDICLPHRRGELDLGTALASLGSTGLSETLKPRLSGNPSPGTHWTLASREGEFMAGTVNDNPQGCQILAVSPFGAALSSGIAKKLAEFTPAFVVDETSGTNVGDGITWKRYTSEAGEFIDIVVYESQGDAQNSTLHITVG